jgi:hypothetical protein
MDAKPFHTFEDLLEPADLPSPTLVVERKEFDGKKFEAHNGTGLKVGTLIGDEAKLRCVSKSQGRLTHGKFYSYARSTIFAELS